MEEYLQNMKNLRYQMNDIEEEAAKRSVEEQKQKTAIETLENDLQLVRSDSKRLNDEGEEMLKVKAQICCQIVEKQRKISLMETESSTHSQTLELLQQERVSVTEKFKEKRSYYTRTIEELDAKLRYQQELVNSNMQQTIADTALFKEYPIKDSGNAEGNSNEAPSLKVDSENAENEMKARYNNLITQLESAESKLEELKAKKSEITLDSNKSKQILEQLKQRIDNAPAELKAIDAKALDEENKALLADKGGEKEYLQSLHDQIKQLKGISHVVKCQCGNEYQVGWMV